MHDLNTIKKRNAQRIRDDLALAKRRRRRPPEVVLELTPVNGDGPFTLLPEDYFDDER